jgi:hypothetical protein
VLKSHGFIDVDQSTAYGDINVRATETFDEPLPSPPAEATA